MTGRAVVFRIPRILLVETGAHVRRGGLANFIPKMGLGRSREGNGGRTKQAGLGRHTENGGTHASFFRPAYVPSIYKETRRAANEEQYKRAI